MSKLEELIQKYCPDGVEYYPLCELFEMRNGYTPSTTNRDYWEGGDIPWFKMEDIRANGRILSDSTMHITSKAIKGKGLFKANSIILATSATIGEHALVLVEHLSNQRFTNLYPQKQFQQKVNMFFMNYYFHIVDDWCKSHTNLSNFASVDMEQLRNLQIPVPPLPVQEEIVRVLETFTELQAELQAELQKRKKQYEHYQDYLLNKSQFSNLVPIGEVCVIKKGNTPIQKAREGVYPLVVTTMERRSSDTYQFNANAVCIPLISSRGHGVASLNHVYYQEGKFALGNILCAVIPTDENVLKAKFLYYYLEYSKDYTLVPLMKGGANVSMHCSDIEKVKIPIPTIQEQLRIISILDKFDTLTNDFTVGLPAEIEKRRQQEEFYRDKLLTFKRKEA